MKSGYVSIVGRPNSGKSTLLNRILGEELSIVTPKAQTTRHKIIGIHNMDGAQIIFLDTPGYHESSKPLNQFMTEQIESAILDSDVICWLFDVSCPPVEIERDISSSIMDIKPDKAIIVLNKVDMIFGRSWKDVHSEYKGRFKSFDVEVISAKTGLGVDELVSRLKEKLPSGEPFYSDDIYTKHPVRFLVSETIREQVFNLMHQEIPYSVAVEVETYKEEKNIHRIHASIIVEKESQKGMVIGKDGAMIKKIGEISRVKIEHLVGIKVFLKLFVRVEKNWTKNRSMIRKFHSM